MENRKGQLHMGEDKRIVSINDFVNIYPNLSDHIKWQSIKNTLRLADTENVKVYDKKIDFYYLLRAIAINLLDVIRPLIDKDLNLNAWIFKSDFLNAPASTKYHCNYASGLIEHSLNVADCLLKYTEQLGLNWERKESPLIIGLLHDVCKTDEYMENDDGEYIKNHNTLFNGHGAKSLHILQTLNVKLTEEEIVCIRYHMGAFTEKEEWNYYTNAIKAYPNVLYTHMADMEATHIIEK